MGETRTRIIVVKTNGFSGSVFLRPTRCYLHSLFSRFLMITIIQSTQFACYLGWYYYTGQVRLQAPAHKLAYIANRFYRA